MKVKVLNLYAGIGGNRRLWDDDLEITAVEYNPKIAAVYQDLYPNDIVIVGDAHEYLLKHYSEFDAIWSSPPCQTHSSFRKNICVNFRGTDMLYPDMKLYEEIILLKEMFKGVYAVENVKPWYNEGQPLLRATFLHRHNFWSNQRISPKLFESADLREAQIPELQKYHNVNLEKYDLKGLNKRQILRNCVESDLGKHIMDCLLEKDLLTDGVQGSLF